LGTIRALDFSEEGRNKEHIGENNRLSVSLFPRIKRKQKEHKL
jgi:hypothetical protein